MNNDLTYKVKRRKAVLYGNSPQESEVEKEIDMFTTIGDKDHFANVWVIASFFRENFFKKYKVLKAWIDKCIADAENDGFTRSSHGIIRRLPYLYYKGKDSSNIKIKNNQNISINSRVQSFESVVVNRWLLDVWNYTREHNLRSYIMGCIHDAGEMYSINSEEQEFIKIVHEFGEKDYPEYNGIPLEVESNLADYHGTYKATKMEKNKKTGEMEEVNAWEVWDQGKEVTY
jgi:hypothetical protein